ncbi:hypothetical protein GCM10009587_34320 [Microbacterium maritypicum]
MHGGGGEADLAPDDAAAIVETARDAERLHRVRGILISLAEKVAHRCARACGLGREPQPFVRQVHGVGEAGHSCTHTFVGSV